MISGDCDGESASSPASLIALSPAPIGVIGPNGRASKIKLSLGWTGRQDAGKKASQKVLMERRPNLSNVDMASTHKTYGRAI